MKGWFGYLGIGIGGRVFEAEVKLVFAVVVAEADLDEENGVVAVVVKPLLMFVVDLFSGLDMIVRGYSLQLSWSACLMSSLVPIMGLILTFTAWRIVGLWYVYLREQLDCSLVPLGMSLRVHG